MKTACSRRQFLRQRGIGRSLSRHKWTRATIVAEASKLEAQEKHIEAGRLWSLLGHEERRAPMNQRQIRKARRQAWAAGDKRAFN